MNCPKCNKPLWVKLDERADPRNLKPEEVWLQCSDVSHCDYGEWLVDVYGERPILLADYDELTAENERLKAEVKSWQDREQNIDEQLAKQRAVPSSEIVRELQAAAIEIINGVPMRKQFGIALANAAARIDALEQEAALAKDHAVTLELAGQNDEVAAKAEAELADLRELRRLGLELAAASNGIRCSEQECRKFYDTKNLFLAHVRNMREGEA